MFMQVIPQKCIAAADDLRQIESRLRQESENIERIASSLRHSEEESMLVIGGKLNKINENLRIKIAVLHRMTAVLEKVALIYRNTEANVTDYEEDAASPQVIYKTIELKAGRSSIVNKTFNKL